MTVEITVIYRAQCDWPGGCLDHLVIHQAQSLVDAKNRARKEGWTFAHPQGSSIEVARCPAHAYVKARRTA